MISTFFLTLLSAFIWGDLTTISCGAMVATGDENFALDLIACYLGSFIHDIFLFFIGYKYLEKIKSFKFINKKIILPENETYLIFYQKNKLSKFLLYKFISKIFMSIPLLLGNLKIDKTEYLKISVLINFIIITSLFFLSYYINLMVLSIEDIPRIENITGAVLSLISYLVYKIMVKIIFKENR